MKRDLTALKAIIKADYKRHVKRFAALEPSKDIVFIGDSIVAYFPLREFGLDKNIHNLGIPGDTTKGVMERLNQVYRLKPKQVILHVGLNDEVLLSHTTTQTSNDIKSIIEALYTNIPNVKIILVSLTPINQKDYPHGTYVIDRDPKFSIEVNQTIKQFGRVQFIDLFHVLSDENGLIMELTTDGIHLNKKGYLIYQQKLENIL